MKSLFEQMRGTYREVGDYLIPNLSLPEDTDNRPVGVWGERRRRYLKKHRKVLYYNLLTSGKLHSHLADINDEAEEMFFRLVKQMAQAQGVTEKLKTENQLLWVGRMNSIRISAIEIINTEIIYA